MTGDSCFGGNNAPLLLLCLIAKLHGIAVDVDSLAHQLALTASTPRDSDLLRLAAKKLGLKASEETVCVNRLDLTPLPALTCLHNGHWVILAAANKTHVLLQYAQEPNSSLAASPSQSSDRASGLPVRMPLEEFAKAWLGPEIQETVEPSGKLLLIASRASLIGDFARFDFSWFIPSLVRYRRLLAEVLGTSIVLQLFALVTPLFWRCPVHS